MEYRSGRISQEYDPETFDWTKPADEILDNVVRGQSHPRPDHQIRDTPLVIEPEGCDRSPLG
jgi:hypothetical protein